MTLYLEKYPLVIFDAQLQSEDRSGQISRGLINAIKQNEMNIKISTSSKDCLDIIAYSSNTSGVILDWDSFPDDNKILEEFLLAIKKLNNKLPIFITTQNHELDDSTIDMLNVEVNFFWKYADTYDFVVGRIKTAVKHYLDSLLPPFFSELLKYSEKHKYAWHTPGHMGGIAFLKSPIGQIFYNFYGENVFRSDLSISVPELGSLMEHSGVNGDAEKNSAKIFGADHSFYVTNGTSTSNKMVVMSCSGKGDVAIVDRNCHKSLQHALTMSDVIPIYFIPTRNAYGIIGTIPHNEFTKEEIDKKIQACPLIRDKSTKPNIAIVTNSTYDGLIYNVNTIKDELAKSNIKHLHFDEAWYPYAHFHPIYNGKYAMSSYHNDYHPTIYSTQSTHKLLAAFSQASMIHVKDGLKPLDLNLFNETFMMHTSTSPQYSIIASLDVATKMMEGQFGYRLVSESISEAIAFRQEFAKIKEDYTSEREWFFDVWQPKAIKKIKRQDTQHFMEITEKDANLWMLNPKESWHGFAEIDSDFTMLDPIKVTVLTPGIHNDASFEESGIPAPIVSKYLMDSGVVDEKTSFYSMLFLFSIGVNKSKSMNLISDLVMFKKAYDANKPIAEIYPDLLENYAHAYHDMGLKDLCDKMHQFLKQEDASNLLMKAFDKLPEQCITPNAAYQHIVKENCALLPLDALEGRVILTMLAPYPPGIPVMMPGEKVNKDCLVIIDYLKMLERFDNTFPGFENEVHGVEIKIKNGQRYYYVNCLMQDAK